ncbi:MAG: Asp23/Gls24 family envelope stress response protein [Actinobacteria bacterium]|nr:MAG: Asp23/Gls24 family envelope stress response protein [Actinomycetota bacterium]
MGRDASARDRADAACIVGIRAARHPDDARPGGGDPREQGVPQRHVLDQLPRGKAACCGGCPVSYVVPGDRGSITVTASTLNELVVRAAESVDGAEVRRGRRRLDIDVADGHAHVRLELSARYGVVLPQLAREVQQRVTDALTTMCGVEVDAVDVSVEAVE